MNDARQKPDRSSLARRLWSFRHAFRGLAFLLSTQANARIHALATLLVIAVGIVFNLSVIEWCAIVGACGLVWMAEALNTAVESLVDLVSPDHHPLAGRAKDVAAGGVLAAAMSAAVIGMFIFGPRLLALLSH